MVKSLKDYVMMYKPTYEFVVKCAFDVNECKECLKFHRAYSGVIRLTKTNEIKWLIFFLSPALIVTVFQVHNRYI